MSVIAIFRQLTSADVDDMVHNRRGRRKAMFEKLRAELRAITEWSRQTQLLRTQTEREAIVIRALRRREITRQLTEIVATN
jgi:hypothetical protein